MAEGVHIRTVAQKSAEEQPKYTLISRHLRLHLELAELDTPVVDAWKEGTPVRAWLKLGAGLGS